MNSAPLDDNDYEDNGFWASYWAKTRAPLEFLPAKTTKFELIIVGSGYTGLSAAISTAPHVSTLVVDKNTLGSGCSSRNGGDLCLGGTFLDKTTLQKHYGSDAPDAFEGFTSTGIELVKSRMETAGHRVLGQQEYGYIHSPRLKNYYQTAPEYREGVDGLPHAPYGLTVAKGYAINPRDYLETLFSIAKADGAEFREHCEITAIRREIGGFTLHTASGEALFAKKILIATNGYTKTPLTTVLQNIIWPVRSNIIVTQPIDATRFEALGWTRLDPLYDTRKLLHYFRRLPDNRILFGMRGAMGYTMDPRFKAKTKADFDAMFPSFSDVKVDYFWSGLIAMTKRQIPFIGELEPGIFAAFGYHGNGIALGSMAGQEIGKLILGKPHSVPSFLGTTPKRFPPHPLTRLAARGLVFGNSITSSRIAPLG